MITLPSIKSCLISGKTDKMFEEHKKIKTKKILFVNPAGFVGGAEQGLLNIISGLTEFAKLFNTKYIFYVACPKGDFPQRAIEMGAKHIPLDFSGSFQKLSRQNLTLLRFFKECLPALPAILALIIKLAALIKKIRPHIVHSNGIKSHLISGLSSMIASKSKCCFHIRDIITSPFISTYTLVSATAASMNTDIKSTLIFNSWASKKAFFKSTFPGSERLFQKFIQARVVHNSIKIPLKDDLKKNQYLKEQNCKSGNSVSGPVFLSMGHLAPLKGFDMLIKAFASIADKIPGSRLIIVGGEPYKSGFSSHSGQQEKLKKLANSLLFNCDDRIIFSGETSSPEEFYKIADIFVLASFSEGFGRVNAEAMSWGIPVISTKVGGIPEVVLHGETGYLCPPGDHLCLAQKMVELAKNKKLRDYLGKNGRKRAEKNLSLKNCVTKIHNIWNEN